MSQTESVPHKVFGWLLVVWGFISAGLGYFTSMLMIHYNGRPSPYPPNGDVLISLLNGLPYGFILASIGYGLINQKPWARKWVLFLLVPFFMVVQPVRYFNIVGLDSELALGLAEFFRRINIFKACPVIIPFVFGSLLFWFFRNTKTESIRGELARTDDIE